jgi:L-alanine-DL-glutamate epimerase-like enolase superfamily enzyme
MSRIRAATEIPIFLDESVFSLQDVLRVAETGAADGFKIKLIKFGGIFGAIKAATVAENLGLSISVGHGLASVIQNAAELHFAATLKYFKMPGEMIGFARMEKDVGSGLEVRGGEIQLPEAPGLGINVDVSALDSN